MFDFFKFKQKASDEEKTNVVKFPELKAAPPPTPEVEKPATIFYRFGVTDKNRLAFQMGYSEITMTREGVQNLIDQLEFFKSQLEEQEEENEQ